MNISRPKKSRFTRLLPSVVALCAVILGLKTTGLVHDAYAQVSGQMAALTNDPVPANKDFAGGEDDQVASASQVDVVNSLGRRRRELDAQSAQLSTQANMIAAAEQRVDAKITQLKQLQTQIATMLGQRDDAQKAQLASLVKTYSIMGKKAGPIFAGLPDDVAIPVAQAMKSDDLAIIMGAMPTDAAKTLTVKLAGKLTLPQTAGAAAPVVAAADPAAAQASSPDAEADAAETTPPAPAPAAKPRAHRGAPPPKPVAEEQPMASPEARKAVQAASAPAAATPASATAPAPENTSPPKS